MPDRIKWAVRTYVPLRASSSAAKCRSRRRRRAAAPVRCEASTHTHTHTRAVSSRVRRLHHGFNGEQAWPCCATQIDRPCVMCPNDTLHGLLASSTSSGMSASPADPMQALLSCMMPTHKNAFFFCIETVVVVGPVHWITCVGHWTDRWSPFSEKKRSCTGGPCAAKCVHTRHGRQ